MKPEFKRGDWVEFKIDGSTYKGIYTGLKHKMGNENWIECKEGNTISFLVGFPEFHDYTHSLGNRYMCVSTGRLEKTIPPEKKQLNNNKVMNPKFKQGDKVRLPKSSALKDELAYVVEYSITGTNNVCLELLNGVGLKRGSLSNLKNYPSLNNKNQYKSIASNTYWDISDDKLELCEEINNDKIEVGDIVYGGTCGKGIVFEVDPSGITSFELIGPNREKEGLAIPLGKSLGYSGRYHCRYARDLKILEKGSSIKSTPKKAQWEDIEIGDVIEFSGIKGVIYNQIGSVKYLEPFENHVITTGKFSEYDFQLRDENTTEYQGTDSYKIICQGDSRIKIIEKGTYKKHQHQVVDSESSYTFLPDAPPKRASCVSGIKELDKKILDIYIPSPIDAVAQASYNVLIQELSPRVASEIKPIIFTAKKKSSNLLIKPLEKAVLVEEKSSNQTLTIKNL